AGKHATERYHRSRVADEFRKTHECVLRFTATRAPGKELAIPPLSTTPDVLPRANTKSPTPDWCSRCAPSCVQLPGDRKSQQFVRDGSRSLPKYHADVKCSSAGLSIRSGDTHL